MTVYIDIYFAVNFAVDFIILTLSCRKCISSAPRRALASVLGAAYACLGLWDIPWIFFSFGARIIVLFLMCALSLFPCGVTTIIKSSIRALAMSVFFSGAVISVINAAGADYGSPIPDFLIAAAIATGSLCIKYIEESFIHKNDDFCLTVEYNGRKITVSGKCDTGNSLKSFDGLPVAVMDLDAVKKLFPKITSPPQLSEFVSPCDFRVIPYSTISDSGMIYGFIPNRLTCGKNQTLNAVIAVAPSKLKVQMLCSPELLT